MKKKFLFPILSAALCLTLISCAKEGRTETTTEEEPSEVMPTSEDNSTTSSESEGETTSEEPVREIMLYLSDLEPEYVDVGYTDPKYNENCLGDEFLLNGFPIEKGLSVHPSDEATSLIYDLSQYDYDTFTAVIGKNDQQKDCKVKFFVYVDNELKYESNFIKENSMEYVEVDIKDADEIKLSVTNGGDSFSFNASTWGYPTIINKEDIEVVSLETQNFYSVVHYGDELVTESSSAIVYYNTGCFKEVGFDDITVSDFEKEQLGPQTIKLTYRDFVKDFDIYVNKRDDHHYLGNTLSKWVDSKSYNGQATSGVDSDDGSQFAIAGIKYNNGIGLYPLSPENAAYLTLDISDKDYTDFHAVVGKTRKAIKEEIVAYVYGDGELLFTSDLLLPGEKQAIDIELNDVDELKLVIDSGDDGIAYDSAGFGDAVVYTKYTQEEIDTFTGDPEPEHIHNFVDGVCECGALMVKDLTAYTNCVKSGGYREATMNHSCLSSNLLVNGFAVNKAISMHSADDDCTITYDVSEFDYDTFVATVGKTDQQMDCKVKFLVYVDNVLAYESALLREDSMEHVEVNIAGAQMIKLVLNNGGDGFSYDEAVWAYPSLTYKSAIKPVDIKLENVSYVQEQNKDIDLSKASAIVTYNNNTFERVNISEIQFGDVDNTQLGSQEINISFKGFTTKTNVFFTEEGKYQNLSAISDKWTNHASFFGDITVGQDCDDKSAFAIGGYKFSDGLGIHPVNDSNPGYLTIDVSSFSLNKLHLVAGKTRKAIAFNATFAVYGDGVALYSKTMTAGEFDIIDLDIEGVSIIKLEVSGADGISYDCAGFGNAVIY